MRARNWFHCAGIKPFERLWFRLERVAQCRRRRRSASSIKRSAGRLGGGEFRSELVDRLQLRHKFGLFVYEFSRGR